MNQSTEWWFHGGGKVPVNVWKPSRNLSWEVELRNLGKIPVWKFSREVIVISVNKLGTCSKQ